MDAQMLVVGSPVFSLERVGPRSCLVSAGGGAAKTGIKNVLVRTR
jgi:hypothetical protein